MSSSHITNINNGIIRTLSESTFESVINMTFITMKLSINVDYLIKVLICADLFTLI